MTVCPSSTIHPPGLYIRLLLLFFASLHFPLLTPHSLTASHAPSAPLTLCAFPSAALLQLVVGVPAVAATLVRRGLWFGRDRPLRTARLAETRRTQTEAFEAWDVESFRRLPSPSACVDAHRGRRLRLTVGKHACMTAASHHTPAFVPSSTLHPPAPPAG